MKPFVSICAACWQLFLIYADIQISNLAVWLIVIQNRPERVSRAALCINIRRFLQL